MENSHDGEVRPYLAGQWHLDRSENYDEFLKAIGVNVIGRQIATRAAPSVEIEQQGDRVIVRTVSGPFVPDEVLTVGQNTIVQQPDGRKVKVCPRWAVDQLTVTWEPTAGHSAKSYTVSRQVSIDDRLITTLQCGDVVCTRVFKRTL